ncbi:MAG: hypothetical protein PQJ60_06655, partial [Spirochaetales bacterium]|nr:hypothetical protein [Spirochaetales bacterium]
SLGDRVDGEEIQKIYTDYHPGETKKVDVAQMRRNKIDKRRKEVEESGCFTVIDHYATDYALFYSSERYIKLLKTYPNNNLPPEKIDRFYEKMTQFIQDNHDEIELKIFVCSELAAKK